ncbi:MAG: hypothetical protein ABSG87_02905 [Verrucomicrobiota bacterium]|jgi:hypothetical protein
MFNSRAPNRQIKASRQMKNECLAFEILISKMDKVEAQSILDEQLSEFVRKPYAQLADLISHPKHITVQSPSGVQYQIEFNIFYDSGAHENLRIVGSIDSGGWRAFMPLTKTLIMKPTGEFL